MIVSFLIRSRVLLPQTGHSIHSVFMFLIIFYQNKNLFMYEN